MVKPISSYTLNAQYDQSSFELGSISRISGQNILKKNACRTKVFYRDVSYRPGSNYHFRIQNRSVKNVYYPMTLFFYDSNHNYIGEQECIQISKKINTHVTVTYDPNTGEDSIDLNPSNQEDFILQMPKNACYLRFLIERPENIEGSILEDLSGIKIFIEVNTFYIRNQKQEGSDSKDVYLVAKGSPKINYKPYEKIDLTGLIIEGVFGITKTKSKDETTFPLQIINNFSVRNFDTLTISSDSESKTYYIVWNEYEASVSYHVQNRYLFSSSPMLMKSNHQVLKSPSPLLQTILKDEDASTFSVASVDPDDPTLIYDDDYTFYEILKDSNGKDYNPKRARITHIGIQALDPYGPDGQYRSYRIPVFVIINGEYYFITNIGSNVCDEVSSDYQRGKIKGIQIKKNPTKVQYFIGEELDLDGIEVVLQYTKTSEEEVLDVTHDERIYVEGFENTVMDPEMEITINFRDGNDIYKASFMISMTQETSSKVLTSLHWLQGPEKTSTEKDDVFSYDGIILSNTYLNTKTKEVEEVQIHWDSPYLSYQSPSTRSIGVKTITMTYTIPKEVQIEWDENMLHPGDYQDEEGFNYHYESPDSYTHIFTFEMNVVFNLTSSSKSIPRLSSQLQSKNEEPSSGSSIRNVINRIIVQKNTKPMTSYPPGLTFEFGCFKECTNLESLIVDGSVDTYEDESFYGSGIKMLVIRSDTKVISKEAFFNCTSLGSIIIHPRTDVLNYGKDCFKAIRTNPVAIVMVPDDNRYNDLVNHEWYSDYINVNTSNISIGEVVDLDENRNDGLGSIYEPIEITEDGEPVSITDDESTTIEDGEPIPTTTYYQVCKAISTIISAKIPERVIDNGQIYPVYGIKDQAYENCENLVTLNIAKGIHVGKYAFRGCTKLSDVKFSDARSVTFSDGVFSGCVRFDISPISSILQKIPDEMFKDCHSNKNLNLSTDLLSIGKNAFYNNDFQSLMIPATVKTIGEGAFSKCTQLNEIFANALDCTISDNSFSDCGTITVYTPNSTMETRWKESKHGNNTQFSIISAIDTYVKYSRTLNGIDYYVDPEHNIEYRLSNENNQRTAVMENGRNMTGISSENGVFIAPSYVFTIDTTNHGEITQYKVLSIAPGCFKDCRQTTSIIDEEGNRTKVPILSQFINSPYIDEIPERCFENSTLKTIDFGHATTIGDYALAYTEISNEKDVILPISAFRIQNNNYRGPIGLFKGCKLERIEHLFDGISYLPDETFEDCKQLKTIIINHEMTLGTPGRKDSNGNEVFSHVFYGCNSVQDVYLLAPIQWQKGIFLRGTLKDTIVNSKGWNLYNGSRIHVSNYDNYLKLKEDTSTHYHLNPMVIGHTNVDLRTIPSTSTKEVTLTSIESESNTVSSNVVVIVQKLNDSQIKLIRKDGSVRNRVVTIPSHLLSSYMVEEEKRYTFLEIVDMGSYFFQDHTLVVVSLPYTIYSISDHMFNDCTSLETISFPKYLKTIGHSAFFNCNSLIPPSIDRNTLPSTLERIDDCAFARLTFPHGTKYTLDFPSRTYSYGHAICLNSCIHKVHFYKNDDFSDLDIGKGMFVDCSGHAGYRMEVHCNQTIYDIIKSSKNKTNLIYTRKHHTYYFDNSNSIWSSLFNTKWGPTPRGGGYFYGPEDGNSNWIKQVDHSGTYPDTVQEDLNSETYSKVVLKSESYPDQTLDGNTLFTTSKILTRLRILSSAKTLMISGLVRIIDQYCFKGCSISQLIFDKDINFEIGCFDDMKSLPDEIFFMGDVNFDVSYWDDIFKENSTKFYVSSLLTYQKLLSQCPYLIHRIAFVHRSNSDWNYTIVEDEEGFLYKKIGDSSSQIVWFNPRKDSPDEETLEEEGIRSGEFVTIPSYILEGDILLPVSSVTDGILSGYRDMKMIFVDTSIHTVPETFHSTEILVSDLSQRNDIQGVNGMVIPYHHNLYTDGYAVYIVDTELEQANFIDFVDHAPETYQFPNKIVLSLNPYTAYIVNYSKEEKND